MYVILAFVLAKISSASKYISITKFFTLICVLLLVFLIILYNFIIASYNPIVEFVLLMMYKLIPDILSFILSKQAGQSMNKLRTGNSSAIYTALTLFKKPSEDWALPFLNFLLVPAVLYSNITKEWAPYFTAKPYRTSL